MARHDWIKNGLFADRPALAVWLFAFTLFLALLPLGLWHVDAAVTQYVRELPSWFRSFIRGLTDLGKSDWELIPAGMAILLLYAIRRWASISHIVRVSLAHLTGFFIFIFVCVAGSGLLAQLLKHIFGRARPRYYETLGSVHFDPMAFKSSFASMPSGHSTTVFAVAMMVALFFPRARLWAFVIAGFLAFTRVLVGAHYVTDVVAGALLGSLFVILMRGLFAWHKSLFLKNERGFELRGRHLAPWMKRTALRALQRRFLD